MHVDVHCSNISYVANKMLQYKTPDVHIFNVLTFKNVY